MSAPGTTRIQDILYDPSAGLLAGELTIELCVPTGVADGVTVYGRLRTTITDGVLDVSLVPNSQITPSGTYYRVTRILRPVGATARDTKTETVVWVVPDTGTATVADVETLSTPTTTATYLPSQISSATAASGQVLTFDGAAVVWADPTGGGGGGGLTSVGLSLPAIFSVSGSPLTSNGTITASLASQSANRVWAGPATGPAAAPTFRALVAADIPSLSYLVPANNLSDLGSASTARTNLGLGTAATQASAAFEAAITAGTTGQYWRGDKSWQTLDKSAVGLSAVENTALSTWAGSTAITTVGTVSAGTWQGTAIASSYIGSHSHAASDITSGVLGVARLGSGTPDSTYYLRGDGAWTVLSKSSVGLGSVENAALSTWAGTSNITTLGTVTTGTWSATAIGPTKGGTGLTSYALGDLLYSDASNSLAKLSGNTTTTRKFLRQTGNGSVSAAPAWDTLTSGDLPSHTHSAADVTSGTFDVARLGSGSPDSTYYLRGDGAWTVLSKSSVGLGNVENTALSTWAGSTSITTLGTIATGTWSGTAVGATKGGTGLTGYTLGDLIYCSATDTLSKLAGNTTATRKFLRQVGNGSVSAAPAWDTLTTADVAASTDKNYVTDAQATVIGNTSGANTGDQNLFASIVVSGQTTVTTGSTTQALTLAAGSNITITTNNTTKTVTIAASGGGGSVQSITNLSNLTSNGFVVTSGGDGTLGVDTTSYVPTTRTVNGHALSANVSVTASDVGLGSVENTALSTWAGTSNITTLGTVTTGTWSATAVGATKGGTGQTTWTLGDLLYSSAANTLSKLSGNTTTTKKFLRQTGDGANSAAPAWDTLVSGDIPSLAGASKLSDYSSAFVNSLTGTSNQVTVSASTGAVTLSLPQSIGTGSSPTFAGLTISGSGVFGSTAKIGTSDGSTYAVLWTTTNHPLYFGANGVTAFYLNAARTLLDITGVTTTSVAALSAVTAAVAQGTITSAAANLSGTVTWNSGGTTFTGWKLAVTDTASAAASLLLDLQVGGTSKFNVDKTGIIYNSGGVDNTTWTARVIDNTGSVGSSNYYKTLIRFKSRDSYHATVAGVGALFTGLGLWGKDSTSLGETPHIGIDGSGYIGFNANPNSSWYADFGAAGTNKTARFKDQTASTGATLVSVERGAGQTSSSTVLQIDGVIKLGGSNSTGSGSAALGANSPATTNTAPYTWAKVITSDGSTGYIPIWK